ncbi:MAG: thiamine phosphate synthase [Opitutales bacterium]
MRGISIQRLHCLTTDRSETGHVEQVEALCVAGARWIQFRMKGADLAEWISVARPVVEVCRRHAVTLIVNDSIEVALAAGADGVHLGRDDCHPSEARRLLGPDAIVGATAHDRDEVRQAVASGVVDYLGVGPFRSSPTKGDFLPPLKEPELGSLLELAGDLPAVVIGGVTPLDVTNLISRGAHGVAVCSALLEKGDLKGNLKTVLSSFEKAMEMAA